MYLRAHFSQSVGGGGKVNSTLAKDHLHHDEKEKAEYARAKLITLKLSAWQTRQKEEKRHHRETSTSSANPQRPTPCQTSIQKSY